MPYSGGGIITSGVELAAALGDIPGWTVGTKFGRNGDIDTAAAEDVWGGGGLYTGQDATADENIEVLSSDANDVGTLVSSGTVTSGTLLTLTDKDADFVSDSVAVGDILVNDTQATHAAITAVTATKLTLKQIVGDSPHVLYRTRQGDSYRIVNAGDTGGALLRLEQLLDSNYERQPSKYVILNGTTGVTVSGNYIRCTRAKVITAGSSGGIEGTITVRQETTTANVFAIMPAGANQTEIAAYTVPAGKILILRRVRAAITRASGAAGSATVRLLVRNFGEVYRAVRDFEVQTGGATEFTQIGGDILHACTDIKIHVESVSDNNTIIDAAFEYLEMDL